MAKLLYVKANCKSDSMSKTFEVSNAFIEAYKLQNPDDEIITLDLYKENINFLTATDLSTVFGPKDTTSSEHPILKYAYQFASADKYVVAAPMWNLAFPAILKAYIDYVSVPGITFKYTAEGPVGLLENKKAVNIVSRGGAYSEGPMANVEMGDRYLRTIFGFLGIRDFQTIAVEKCNVQGIDVDAIVKEAKDKAISLSKNF